MRTNRKKPPRRKVIYAWRYPTRGWNLRLVCGHHACANSRRGINPPEPKTALCYACLRGDKPIYEPTLRRLMPALAPGDVLVTMKREVT